VKLARAKTSFLQGRMPHIRNIFSSTGKRLISSKVHARKNTARMLVFEANSGHIIAGLQQAGNSADLQLGIHDSNHKVRPMAKRPLPPTRQPKPAPGSSLNDEGVDMLYQELADAERAHRMEEFWKRFGVVAVALSLAVVVGTSVYVYYRHSVKESQMAATSDFYRIEELLDKGQLEEAAKRFGARAEEVDSSMRPLLLLRQAEVLVHANKKDEALDVLRKIAAMDDADIALRDTARLSIARHSTNMEEVQQMLAAAAKTGAPFAPLAQQMRAAVAMGENRPEEAISALNAADAGENLPAPLKARTEELRAVFTRNQAANNADAPSGLEKAPAPAEAPAAEEGQP
jgi:hypothetical protein